MNLKNYSFLILLTIILFFSLSGVFANENVTNQCNLTAIDDSFNEMDYSQNQNDNSFEELAIQVNETPEGGILTLTKDYEFINGSNKGILISKPITIDGAGHTLNGNHLSRMFNVTSDNVIIKNINFINGNAFGRYYSDDVGGGAIYWSGNWGYIENCNFTNNTGSDIEDDPFDKELVFENEDGTVNHIINVRPMGAKTNEGGAIVWNGTNGIVNNCIFIENDVGYPNDGGAICWRGDNGKIINSKFYQNSGWCGSAIAWIGNNGSIISSVIANSTFINHGIYWFGGKGTIKNCIMVQDEYDVSLKPEDADVKADYNFWGDTLENPNQAVKINGVSKWFLMSFTHNGEFIDKNQEILIEYGVNHLMNNGKISKCEGIINYSGKILFKAPKPGFLNINFVNNRIVISVDSKDKILSGDLTVYYSKTLTYKVSVFDVSGKVIGKYVKFKVNNKIYNVKTDKNGVAVLKLKLKPGKYNVYSYYGKLKSKNKIIIKNTLLTKNLSKKAKKSAIFKVKVLNFQGKAFKKQLVKIKFKGKTYKLKTNKKGIATFKIPKNLKTGKYKIKTTCNGLTNTNKIIVSK